MSYAEDTSVPVERSRAEIEKMIVRAGASKFASMISEGEAAIGFVMGNKHVKFTLPMPDRNDKRFTHWKPGGGSILKARHPDHVHKSCEKACRSRWRALALCIKAKLEAVEVGITDFETEFLSYFVTPGGMTVGERVVPLLNEMARTGKLPPLMLQ